MRLFDQYLYKRSIFGVSNISSSERSVVGSFFNAEEEKKKSWLVVTYKL